LTRQNWEHLASLQNEIDELKRVKWKLWNWLWKYGQAILEVNLIPICRGLIALPREWFPHLLP
jgi:hypothetical protein